MKLSEQGCPNEGEDKRFLGWLICPIQRALSFKSHTEPASITFAFPFYLAINLPRLWVKLVPQSKTEWGLRRVLHFHVGWRYDVNGRLYIFPAWSLKTTGRAVFY